MHLAQLRDPLVGKVGSHTAERTNQPPNSKRQRKEPTTEERRERKKKRLLEDGRKGKHILLIPRLFETRVGGDARAKKASVRNNKKTKERKIPPPRARRETKIKGRGIFPFFRRLLHFVLTPAGSRVRIGSIKNRM